MDAKPLSEYVDTSALPWRDSPYAGVRWKKVAFDQATGESTVLLKFEPGASYGSHRHPSGESYYVLEGELEEGSRSYGPGTWVRHPPGSVHRPRSAAGCTVLVMLPSPIEDLEAGKG